MSGFILQHPGRDIVEYWREVLAKDERYAPTCDHERGEWVIDYIDALHTVIAERDNYADQLRGTIQFNRERYSELEAERNRLRRQVRELDEALSLAELRLSQR